MTSEKEGKDGIGCNMVFFLVFFFLVFETISLCSHDQLELLIL